MNRLSLLLFAGVTVVLIGCGKDETSSNAPAPPSSVSTPSAKPLPDEYRTLAKNLAQEMKPAPGQFRDDMDMIEIMAEGHSAIVSLRGIQSSDQDIMYIASQGQTTVSEALHRLERINALPKPPGAGELFAGSFLDGLFGNVYGGYARALNAEEKQNAIIAEAQPLIAAIEKADAVHQMLPMIAQKYSATFSDSTNRIVVDFDESWGWFRPHDWFCICNRGAALEDCTILVQLTGASGEMRKNVHFVKEWPASSWMYGRYEGGRKVLERQVGRATVLNVQKVDVTVFSPKFATRIEYIYQGDEKDRDVAERCEDLKFTGRYQPFVSGILLDTQRGAEVTLGGVAFIPKCRVDVTFRNASQSKAWQWELDYWMNGEKTFSPPKGELTFDPSHIDMAISFPDTSYVHKVTLSLKR